VVPTAGSLGVGEAIGTRVLSGWGKPLQHPPTKCRCAIILWWNKLDPVAFVPEVFAQRAVREARNADGGTALTACRAASRTGGIARGLWNEAHVTRI
jgi:hypothetical protein